MFDQQGIKSFITAIFVLGIIAGLLLFVFVYGFYWLFNHVAFI